MGGINVSSHVILKSSFNRNSQQQADRKLKMDADVAPNRCLITFSPLQSWKYVHFSVLSLKNINSF